jgi:hypothetical protein
LSVPLDVVSIDANRMAGDLERMVMQLDEPLADPASLNVLYIAELARKQGIKVLLSGAGGMTFLPAIGATERFRQSAIGAGFHTRFAVDLRI